MRKFTCTLSFLLAGFIRCMHRRGPTVPASNLQFPASNIDGNRFTVSFNKGNGAFRIIVVKQGSAITSLPVNGVEYIANAAFGTANTVFAPAMVM
ncbi:MAG: hypothetical protein WDO16_17030 [Bacteroidota bacterium]